MYAKVFGKIMDSSIAADWYLRHVFMDLLVLADRDGIVDMTIDAIRRRTNAPDETMLTEAIRRLEQPDERSRSETDDGRRIELIDDHRDWGWKIINYGKYRNLKTSQEIREQTAERVRKYRAKKRPVTPAVTQAEAYAEADAKADKRERERQPKTLEEVLTYWKDENLKGDPKMFYEHHQAGDWRQSGKPLHDWKAAARYWSLNEKNMVRREEKPKKPGNVHTTPGRYSTVESEEIKP